MSDSFFDTNVLLYIASGDRAKAERTEELIAAGGVVSVQVLNEFTNVARRKMALPWSETRALLSILRRLLPVRPLTVGVYELGLDLAERYRLSVYDAMIAAAALDAECDMLWSEDMQDGMVLADRLHIADPFR